MRFNRGKQHSVRNTFSYLEEQQVTLPACSYADTLLWTEGNFESETDPGQCEKTHRRETTFATEKVERKNWKRVSQKRTRSNPRK